MIAEVAFERYHVWSLRTVPHASQQRARWADYAPVYYDLHDRQSDDRFVAALHALIAQHDIRTALDVGCGGLQLMNAVTSRWPHLAWTGIDITDESAARFAQVRSHHPAAAFVQGSLMDHLTLLDTAELVYSYNTFMYFSGDDMRVVFRALAQSRHFRSALLHEPFTVAHASHRNPNRLMDYLHPFEALAHEHGLTVTVDRYSQEWGTFTIVRPSHPRTGGA